MSEFNWAQLQAEAEKSDIPTDTTPVPAGDYLVRIAKAEVKPCSNGQKQMIKVRAKIEEGPHAKKTIWNNFVISPESADSMAIFFRHMAAFGLTGDWFNTQPAIESVAQALTDRTAVFTTSIGSYKNKPTVDVDDVQPAAAFSSIPPAQVGAVPPPPVPTPQQAPVPPVAPAPPAPPAAPPAPTAPTPTPAAPVAEVPVPPAAPAPPAPPATIQPGVAPEPPF
jgi:hypothetical protein